MSRYDNWERLMNAVLKREQFRRLALASSRESSFSSVSSDLVSNLSTPIHDHHRNIQPGNYWDDIEAGFWSSDGPSLPRNYHAKTEEAANVRLVRCPKCNNLLPELAHYSLYQCGGCGALLKAKKNGLMEDGLLEKISKKGWANMENNVAVAHDGTNEGNDINRMVINRSSNTRTENKVLSGGRSRVSVNGHFIPDRLVEKAEKLAGPIRPGNYWYDVQAGFWGVMGHPCLGITMPNIKEFHYPMPENCAAGNTGVFVNGRELHQKDLDLLASRGLPITSARSYRIQISGEVVDEQIGEELDGLGKLAPTIERNKRGFGMKVPQLQR